MPKRILIAEDERDLAELACARLSARGYDVAVAYDGFEALDKIQSDPPDLVLLDLRMPGKSGYEVCQELRKDDRLKHIPLVLVTASTAALDPAWQAEGTIDGVLTKPYEAKDLLNLVRSFLKDEE